MSEQYRPMGQQTESYSQSTGQQYQPTGQQMGQQPTGQQMGQGMSQGMGQGTGQQMSQGMGQQGGQFHSSLPQEFRMAIEEFSKVAQIAEWCADKCIENPQMADCARACEDLADLAELNEKLIARDSIHGPQVAEAYLKVAQQALPTLQQFQHSSHVGETLSAVTRSIQTVNQLLSSIGYQQTTQMGEMGQQGQGMQGMSQGTTQQSSLGQGSFQQSSY